MKRHWTHRLGLHRRCHPAACRKAADLCNWLESQHRMEEHAARRNRNRELLENPYTNGQNSDFWSKYLEDDY